MAYLTDEEIENEAIKLRQAMALPLDKPLTAEMLIAGIDKAFPGVRLVVVPDEEMTFAAAEADPHEKKIRFRQTAYNQLKNNSAWGLETLAHELSHFQLKHDGIRYRRGGINHSRKIGNDEPQAHLLAKAILAPASKAAVVYSAQDLAREFNLTKSSAEKRYEVVQRMHRRQNSQPRQLPQNVIDFLTEARARGAKVTAID
jgi:hypothetical protein